MSEREQILNILSRLERKIYSNNPEFIEFDGDGRESITIEFDKEGLVTAIY